MEAECILHLLALVGSKLMHLGLQESHFCNPTPKISSILHIFQNYNTIIGYPGHNLEVKSKPMVHFWRIQGYLTRTYKNSIPVAAIKYSRVQSILGLFWGPHGPREKNKNKILVLVKKQKTQLAKIPYWVARQLPKRKKG